MTPEEIGAAAKRASSETARAYQQSSGCGIAILAREAWISQ